MSKFPKLQFSFIDPKDHRSVDYVISSNQDCILAYNSGILKFISERIETSSFIKGCPKKRKRFNLHSMYKDYLLRTAPQKLDAWEAFLNKRTINVGVTHKGYASTFQSALEEALPSIANLVRVRAENYELA